MTLFYTDLDRGKVEVRQIEKCGRNAVDSNALFIDGLEIPEEDRIGEEGRGFQYLLHGLNSERIIVAAGILGASRYVLDKAVQYAKDRVVFGRPIGMNQSIQHPLAELWIQQQAAELMLFKGATLYDSGAECGPEVNAREIPVRRGVLQVGVTRGPHAWRHGLREGVPCRAVFPRIDPAVDRSGQPGAGAVLRRRAGAGVAEIVLRRGVPLAGSGCHDRIDRQSAAQTVYARCCTSIVTCDNAGRSASRAR